MGFQQAGRAFAAATVLTVGASTAHAATAFDITLDFAGGLTASQQTVFSDAAMFLESVVTGFQYEIPGHTGPVISASAAPNDGVGGVLAYAGPTSAYVDVTSTSNPYAYSTAGIMSFDSADLASLETAGNLLDVVVHEMAHVLGFGTLWQYVGAYNLGTGQYTGAGGLLGYQLQCDASATHVPVELDGGPGTSDGHWDENWACGGAALLTGYIEGPTFLSWATIGSFVDLGYLVSMPSVPAVPLPAGVLFLGTGLGALGLMRRRKSRTS